MKPLHRHQSCQKECQLRPAMSLETITLEHTTCFFLFFSKSPEQTSPDTKVLVSSLLIWAAHIVVEIIKSKASKGYDGKGAMTSQSLEVEFVYMIEHHLSISPSLLWHIVTKWPFQTHMSVTAKALLWHVLWNPRQKHTSSTAKNLSSLLGCTWPNTFKLNYSGSTRLQYDRCVFF